MPTTLEFTYPSRNAGLEHLPLGPLEMPAVFFTPSRSGRGHALDAALPRLPSHSRGCRAQQTPPDSHAGLDPAILYRPNCDVQLEHFRTGELNSRYLPYSRGSTEDLLGNSLMVPHDDMALPSPGPTSDIFGAPGCFGNLREGLETARPHSGFARHPRVLDSYGPLSPTDSNFADNLVFPLPASDGESPIVQQRPPSDWECAQTTMFGVFSALPSNSQNSRCTSALSPAPSNAHLMRTFDIAHGVPEDVPQWQINQAKKGDTKKWQRMACLFCRARKIGCTRPAEHEPDQTCSQCARRRRRCVYPTNSFRGQHPGSRRKSKE
ncbi:hypothetical protein C8R47DRAFT_1063168 [Mycena vitilis]|nr:hypothetical protein C8R47DRAFT_1063168 [Mycena vitilis]